MFSKQDLLDQLESILDVSSLVEVEEGNYLIDNLNQFGFSLDFSEGITIYYRGEHFHLWKTPADNETTYDDILSNFKGYIKRLLTNKILFIYTFRGKVITRIKIVEYGNEDSVIENYSTSINPIRLLFKKKEQREIIEFKQNQN